MPSDSYFQADISRRVNMICDLMDNRKRVVTVAPWQSGKTTLINFVMEALKNKYICIYVNCQSLSYESNDDIRGFWKSLNRDVSDNWAQYLSEGFDNDIKSAIRILLYDM